MPRKPKAPQPIEQAALFSDAELPEQPALIEAARVYRPNGKTTCKNEERAFAIVEDLLCGMSQRKVCLKHHVGSRTVAGVLRILEQTGKLAPLKERLVQKFGTVVEKGIDAIDEALTNGTFPVTHLGLMEAQITDKLLLLQGDATVIVGQAHGPTTEQINDWIENLPRVASGPVGLLEISLNKGGPSPAVPGPAEQAEPVLADGQSIGFGGGSAAKEGKEDV